MPRQKRDWFKIPVDITEALSTLADGAGLLQGLTTAVLEHDARVTSVELTYNLTEGDVGEGPISVWLAHSDYSLTEVEEVIELTGLLGPGNMVEREIASRFVRHIGDLAEIEVAAESAALNDGMPVKTRLNWLIPDQKTINLCSYNNSGAQLSGGMIVRVQGHINGFWT